MRRVHLALVLIAGFALLVGAPTVFGQADKGPETVVLTGAPTGGVKLAHLKHGAEYAGGKCETCHHPSKAEKAATAPQQKCSDCHTKAAAAPMKTKYQAAFHNPMAKEGTCITCHLEQNKGGKAAPVKCPDCHKKENK